MAIVEMTRRLFTEQPEEKRGFLIDDLIRYKLNWYKDLNKDLKKVVNVINESSNVKIEDVDQMISILNEAFKLEDLYLGCDVDNVLITVNLYGHTYLYRFVESFEYMLAEIGIEDIETVIEAISKGQDFKE